MGEVVEPRHSCRCGVSDKTVAVVREIHTAEIPQYESTARTFTHSKTGKPTTMKTGKIGGSMPKRKKPKSDAISPKAFPVIHEHTKHVPKRALELPLFADIGRQFGQSPTFCTSVNVCRHRPTSCTPARYRPTFWTMAMVRKHPPTSRTMARSRLSWLRIRWHAPAGWECRV